MSSPLADFRYYHYNPSLAGGIIFTVIFSILTILHLAKVAKFRTFYFTPMIIGGIFELVGYAARCISSKETPNWTLAPYIIQSIFLLVAPALFAASIYMILGRIIISIDGESHSLIKKRWLTKVFVTGDVLSFLMQSGGGGILAKADSSSTQNLGTHVILGGLFLQIIIFGFFVVVTMIFHRRMLTVPTILSSDPSLPWQKHLHVLYITSLLIMVRSVVRVVEFAQGFGGVIIEHEWYLYVFDALAMAAVMAVFVVWYPTQFTKNARRGVGSLEPFRSSTANSDLELATK